MESLNNVVVVEILRFLKPKELPEIMLVSKFFRECARSDYIWRKYAQTLFPDASSNCYAEFLNNVQKFLKISNSFYDVMEVLKTSEQRTMYKSLLATSNPLISYIIPKYHCSEEGTNPYSSYSDFTRSAGNLSLEVYWFFLLYNGQSTCHFGLFGSYDFYDIDVSLRCSPATLENDIVVIAKSGRGADTLALFIDVFNKIGMGTGAVYFNSGLHGTVLYLAPSLSDYFQSYSRKIKLSRISLKDEALELYENNKHSSVNSANGIKIYATALYIPHLSRDRRYLWSYKITISADNPDKDWKLTTRTWRIVDSNGKVQEVNRQPGVIGLYPEVKKNSLPVSYTSCCYLETVSGVMSGFFTFKNLSNSSETIDVAVNPFGLELPENSEIVDIKN